MFHVEQLVFEFKDLPFPLPLPIEHEQKEIVLPDNRIIEIIKPIPLEDLLHMAEVIRDGHDSERARELDQLGRGAFGTVLGYKEYAIKYFRNGKDCYEDSGYGQNGLSDKDEIRDVTVLRELQFIPSIPRLYAVIDGIAIIMERVNGHTCDDYMSNVRTAGYKGNYISKRFNKVYIEDLIKIAKYGFEPNDLHGGNVMVCKKTGLPKIVDVGLFKKFEERKIESIKEKSEDEILEIYSVQSAKSWIADRLESYIDRKKDPAKWKAIDIEEKRKVAEYKEERKRRLAERRKNQHFMKLKDGYKIYVEKFENRPFFED